MNDEQKRKKANERMRRWYRNNPERAREIQARYRAKHPGRAKRRYIEKNGRNWVSAQDRARKLGIKFTIAPSDVVVPKRCPLLGLVLKHSKGRATENSPSLDRKDTSKGYVPGNVWVISHRANRLKNNATLRELEKLVRNLRKAVRK